MTTSEPVKKQLSLSPHIHPTARVQQCRLGRYTEVGPRTRLQESEMDDYSYIVNDGNVIHSRIGKFCSIAAMVRINPGNHPMHRAAQHHFTYRSRQFGMGEDDAEVFRDRRNRPVVIGHDVWIGHGAVVLPGVRIGTGAVVGAGAVVSKDVAPYTLVAGVPAKVIRRRFSRDIEQALLRIQWWHWSHEQLQQALSDFRNPDIRVFIDKYGRNENGRPSSQDGQIHSHRSQEPQPAEVRH